MNLFDRLITFRKSDRDAIAVLLVVIIACVVLIPLLATQDDEASSSAKQQKEQRKSSQYYAQPGENDGSRPAEQACELFPFDPNTADSTQLLRLGLKPWQVRSIYKYRSHGGRYYKPTDFARLYGLTLEKYRQLEPYIRIKKEIMARDVITGTSPKTCPNPSKEGGLGSRSSNQNEAANNKAISQSSSLGGVRGGFKLRQGETIDINTADTTMLKRIPGIGSYFAHRIVELRQRRQAFTSPEELLSIRNFPETSLTYMTASQTFPKIHINVLSEKELERHPLINYAQARDIIKLRKTVGAIKSAEDLSALPSFPTQSLRRLAPFLIFD